MTVIVFDRSLLPIILMGWIEFLKEIDLTMPGVNVVLIWWTVVGVDVTGVKALVPIPWNVNICWISSLCWMIMRTHLWWCLSVFVICFCQAFDSVPSFGPGLCCCCHKI